MKQLPKTKFVKNTPTDLSASDNLFQSEAWLKVIEESYGLERHTIVTEDGSEFHFFEVPSFEAKRLVMSPFCDYTALNTNNKEQLLEVFLKISSEYPEAEITIKSRGEEIEIPVNLEVSRRAVLHTIPLKKKVDFSPKFKWAVRKARKSGLEVSHRTDEDAMRNFYHLHKSLRKNKFNSISQPWIFFENIYNSFLKDDKGSILEVSHNNMPVASAIMLAHNDRWYYKFSASSSEHLKLRPNDLLFHEMITSGFEKGFSYIDLGLSGLSKNYEGLRKFKSSMGGVESPLTTWRYQPPGFDSNRQNRFTGEITKALVQHDADGPLLEEMSKTLYPYFG